LKTLDKDRELTLSFFPSEDGWVVRLDEFSLAGSGSSQDEAVTDLASSFKYWFEHGVLETTKPVPKRQLLMEIGSKKVTRKTRVQELLDVAGE